MLKIMSEDGLLGRITIKEDRIEIIYPESATPKDKRELASIVKSHTSEGMTPEDVINHLAFSLRGRFAYAVREKVENS